MHKTILLTALVLSALSACVERPPKTVWDERHQDSLQPRKVQEGVPAWDAASIDYKRDGKTILEFSLPEPHAVAVADQDWGWGFFQFPSIGMDDKGDLSISWQMATDSRSPDGKRVHYPNYLVSTDKGKTWHETGQRIRSAGQYSVRLSNGDILSVHTIRSLYTNGLDLPEPVEILPGTAEGEIAYYRVKDLPDTLQGTYLDLWHHDSGETELIHASVEDPCALRYSQDNYFPLIWWGNIREDKDGSLYALPYPTFYETPDHKATQAMSASLYRSVDRGRSWTLQGAIPYKWDSEKDPRGAAKRHNGFSEHTFTILPDGSFYCVMRSDGPMYWTRSIDKGKTWTDPKCLTPYGVKPYIFTLDNGLLVLVSGRPGVQIRVSADGLGETWTDPVELIHYGEYTSWRQLTVDSCGNADIKVCGRDSFYIVYSDFKYPATDGKLRKAIKFRKVTIKKK